MSLAYPTKSLSDASIIIHLHISLESRLSAFTSMLVPALRIVILLLVELSTFVL